MADLSPTSDVQGAEPTTAEVLAEIERRQQERQLPPPRQLSPFERRLVLGVDRFIYGVGHHWLTVANIFVLFYVGLAVLAPVLMAAGLERPARVIHALYTPLCHQLPFRSFYLFGPQLTYTADELLQRVGSEALLPHSFLGNAELGFKIALCQRDMAIYGMILLAGLVYGLSGKRWRPMPGWAYVVFGLLPVGLDGGLQLLYHILVQTVPSLQLPSFESTPLRRVVTGALFGLATAWLAYPYIQASFEEMMATLEQRLELKR